MKYKLLSLTVICTLFLWGCSNLKSNPELTAFGMGGGRVTAAGANQLFGAEIFEKIDLLYALDLDGKRVDHKSTEDLSDKEIRKEFQKAYEVFDKYDKPKYRRNRIQDQIIGASEQRCNLFKAYIKRMDSTNKVFTGSMATLLGGLGAIFTPANTARALSGSASIFSGIGAEFKQGFFSDVATHVLVPGIEAKRKKIRDEIDEKRQENDLETYTVERAIADAVRFHGACSIDVGLQAASEALKEAENPGKPTVDKVIELREKINSL
uniref:Uncharacterized protein n=1 Tax=Candidatus Kentrum sp. TUN TaxID=2126343 RepID=A0A451A6J9_9GAMM|nr:MAG: hypothetical protein BECKTUN1418F_GA0071002_12652 [Candidatus Kentron sp. TUN]VFK64555.1 MAG: hypothetical protein BECKTUN1418D_GA0071000_12712 [Candidatus Kentron sp. TUN]VFK70453.1 MAG: hypothetical protein BECKTUN1418E_GA0071001_12672 [Candidatus Kentron sp. TUN]